MRKNLSTFLILGLLASCNATKTASTTKGSINADAPYLWLTPNFPKVLSVSAAFNVGSEATHIQSMGDAWSSAVNNEEDFFNYSTGGAEKTATLTDPGQFDDNIFGVYKAAAGKWPYPDYPDALAVTQIFAFRYNRGEADEFVAISEADIIMNYENFDFDDPDPSVTWDYDFRTVMLHEMGHFLGLGHKSRSSDRTSSVMFPSIFPGETKRAPRTVDISDIASKYGIIIGGGGAPAMAGELPTYTPNGEGEPVKIILELKASGDCVHHENGIEIKRHKAF